MPSEQELHTTPAIDECGQLTSATQLSGKLRLGQTAESLGEIRSSLCTIFLQVPQRHPDENFEHHRPTTTVSFKQVRETTQRSRYFHVVKYSKSVAHRPQFAGAAHLCEGRPLHELEQIAGRRQDVDQTCRELRLVPCLQARDLVSGSRR